MHRNFFSQIYFKVFIRHFVLEAFLLCPTDSIYIMSSPGQRRGSCGHAMANFDTHQYCARCREKGKGSDPCIKEPQSDNCSICNAFSEEQRQQLATPSYRLKKEKREAKKLVTAPPQESEELVDPASVAVIGAVDKGSLKSPSPAPPPEKKTKKDLKKDIRKDKSPPAKASKSTSQTTADSKIADLDLKWSERFNRLEALILSKNFEPTFSANVKVTPTHSPPSSIENVSEPFIRPSTSSTLPGNGSSAEKHQPTSKAVTDKPTCTVRASLLPSISRSVKLNPADLHQPPSFLDKAPLLVCISLPVKLLVADLLHWTRFRTGLLLPTDLSPQDRPTPALLLCIDLEGIVYPAFPQRPTVSSRTDRLWIYTRRKGNSLRTRIKQSWTRTNLFRKNKIIERQCKASALIWDGPIFQRSTT